MVAVATTIKIPKSIKISELENVPLEGGCFWTPAAGGGKESWDNGPDWGGLIFCGARVGMIKAEGFMSAPYC